MLDTISFSVAGGPMSSVLTKVKGARRSSESASLQSGRGLVVLEVNSLCSVKRRMRERKKNKFWMWWKIATTLGISVFRRMAVVLMDAPVDIGPNYVARAS